jgi:hypothetical protein
MRWSGFRNRMSDSAANREDQKSAMRFALKASPPNVFIGGPVPNPPGFPPKDGSVQSFVADPLKTCGNDGLPTTYLTRLKVS